jgi:hypothetical protein
MINMTVSHLQFIDDEFLSKTDRAYLTDLVSDWLNENNHEADSFEFSVRVQWEKE